MRLAFGNWWTVTRETFQTQIKRLRNAYAEKTYSDERCALFWRAFQQTPDDVFVEAIDLLIATHRVAPMFNEIEKSVSEIRARGVGNQRRGGDPNHAILREMELGLANTEDPNTREFAKRCIQLLKDKIDGKISREHFFQGCDLLDQAARIQSRVCADCGGDGFVRVQNERKAEILHRCHCRLGDAHPAKVTYPDGKEKFIPRMHLGA